MRGKVKWWNDAKGYGFIAPDAGEDVFVHFSTLKMDGHRTLAEGQVVEFDVEQGTKGPQAVNVVPDPPETVGEDATQTEYDREYMAVALLGDQIKVVSLTADGQYRFLDRSDNMHNLVYVLSRETQAMAEAVEELEYLVNNLDTTEHDYQKFFERHKDFILNDGYADAHPKVELVSEEGETLIPDFVLQPIDQGSLCDLLELKLPSAQVYVLEERRTRCSAAVLEACAQLRNYSRYFDEQRNRELIYSKYGLRAYKPKMFVIIGRRGKVDPVIAQDAQSDLPGIELRTYDQVLARAKAKVEAMKTGRRL